MRPGKSFKQLKILFHWPQRNLQRIYLPCPLAEGSPVCVSCKQKSMCTSRSTEILLPRCTELARAERMGINSPSDSKPPVPYSSPRVRPAATWRLRRGCPPGFLGACSLRTAFHQPYCAQMFLGQGLLTLTRSYAKENQFQCLLLADFTACLLLWSSPLACLLSGWCS